MNNMEKINNPESIIMVADKTRYVPKKLQTYENKQKILDRSLEIFGKFPLKSDKGDKLRAIILVFTLNKYEFKHRFYERILVKIIGEFDDIQANFLLTMVESFTYNKIQFSEELHKEFMRKTLKLFENLSIRDLKLYPKIIQLFIYRSKNLVEFNEKPLFLPVILGFYNNILNFILKERRLQFTVLVLIETMNYLANYNEIAKNENLFFLYNQLQSKIDDFFEKNSLKIQDFPLASLIAFFSSFSNYKASFLPKKILGFFQDNFSNYKLDNLKFLAIYLHFLSRHVENYEISIETMISINKFLDKDYNLMILTKLLEVFYSAKPVKSSEIMKFQYQEEILGKLEEKSLRILKRLNYPLSPLLQIFQNLAFLARGKRENWLIFLDFFSRKSALEELDYLQIIVKLIPTAANKAKQEFKLSTNIAMNMAPVSGYLKNSKEKIELVLALERFWRNLEDFLVPILPKIFINKYPIILMHMVYANLTFRKFIRIHQNLMKPILGNLEEFTVKNLSGIMYRYT